MEGRLVLKNCVLPGPSGELLFRKAVTVEGERISEVADDDRTWIKPGDWQVSCNGRLVALGRVEGQAHLVSEQLWPLLEMGQSPVVDGPVPTPTEMEALLAFGLARALREGVTHVSEHLPFLGDVEGALAAARKWASKLGIRMALSHASQDLDSGIEARRCLEAGGPADLLVLDDWPPENSPGEGSAEFARRVCRARVAWVVCRGRVVVREGRLLGADYARLAKEAARAVSSVQSRKGTQ
jgi:cytosine/adenosine deaminase-related metal-dependent hydrolase